MKSKNIHIKQNNRWVVIGATGLGLAFSFPPYPFPFVSCVALIPILRRWHHAGDPREIYLDCFYSFLILFAISFSWPLTHPFTNTAIASLSGVLLIPMTLALPFAFSLSIKTKLGLTWGLVAFCAFFLSTEWIWAHGPVAMPGALLGHALSNQLYVNQMADLSGVAGLSLWILLINLIGMLMLESTKPLQEKKLISFLVFLLIFAPGYSIWRLQSEVSATGTTKVAVVQPAIPSVEWSDEKDVQRVARLQKMTDSLLILTSSKPDLVIWPETSLPVSSSLEDSLYARIKSWVKMRGFDLLTGAILTTQSNSRSTAYTNSAMLFSHDTQLQRYNKNWLVPFAEHVPFERAVNSLANLRVDAGGVAGYQPGTSQPLIRLKSDSIGVLICFESLFGDYTRRYANKGAAFLVALSNTGWWGSQTAPEQYLAFSRLRAIESRRSLVINTVTGPALIVDRWGQTSGRLEWMDPGLLVADIPHSNRRSFYTRNGDWLGLLSLVISLLILAQYFFVAKE